MTSGKQPPSGQPQPRNPLRAALERFGRERGQPQPRLYRTVAEEQEFREAKEKYGLKDHWPQGQSQPCPRCKRPIEGSMAVHYAEDHGEYAPLYLVIRDGMDVPFDQLSEQAKELDRVIARTAIKVVQQERQAGGHLHERGQETANGWLCKNIEPDNRYGCPFVPMDWFWFERGVAQGVADAAAQAKER